MCSTHIPFGSYRCSSLSITGGTTSSFVPSGSECQQIEPDEREVVRPVGPAQFVDARDRLTAKGVLQLRWEIDLVRLQCLAREPTGDRVAVERAALCDRAHEATLDVEPDVEQQVEIRAGVEERPRRLRRAVARNELGDVV